MLCLVFPKPIVIEVPQLLPQGPHCHFTARLFSRWTTRFVSRSPALGLPCLSAGQPGAFPFLLGKPVVRGVNFRSLETTFGREILEGRAAVIDISVTIGSPELSSLLRKFFPSLSDRPGVGEGASEWLRRYRFPHAGPESAWV